MPIDVSNNRLIQYMMRPERLEMLFIPHYRTRMYNIFMYNNIVMSHQKVYHAEDDAQQSLSNDNRWCNILFKQRETSQACESHDQWPPVDRLCHGLIDKRKRENKVARLVWDFDCLHFAQYILISPHGIDCKQNWCKKMYRMN